MTTFALDYAGGQRQLWLRRRARPLALDDIPIEWRRPRIAYVGAGRGRMRRRVRAGAARAVRRRRGCRAGCAAPPTTAASSPRASPTRPRFRMPPRLDVAIVSEEDHPAPRPSSRRVAAGAARRRSRAARAAPRSGPARESHRRPGRPGARGRSDGRGRRVRRRADAGARAGDAARRGGTRRRRSRRARRRGPGAGNAARGLTSRRPPPQPRPASGLPLSLNSPVRSPVWLWRQA